MYFFILSTFSKPVISYLSLLAYWVFCYTSISTSTSVPNVNYYIVTSGNWSIQVSQGGQEWEVKAPAEADKQLPPWRYWRDSVVVVEGGAGNPPPGAGVNKAPARAGGRSRRPRQNCLQITELTRINFQGGAK